MNKSSSNPWLGITHLTLSLIMLIPIIVGIRYRSSADDLRKGQIDELHRLGPLVDHLSEELQTFEGRNKDDPELKEDFQTFMNEHVVVLHQAEVLDRRLKLADDYDRTATRAWIAVSIMMLIHIAVSILIIRNSRAIRYVSHDEQDSIDS